MSVTTEKDELVIRIPLESAVMSNADIEFIKQYLKLKSLQAKSKSSESEVREIAGLVKKGWWAENKESILKNAPRRN